MKKFFAFLLAFACLLASVPMFTLSTFANEGQTDTGSIATVQKPVAKVAFDENGLTDIADGGNVSTWASSGSVANRDATRSQEPAVSSLTSPTLKVNGLNGNPTVVFNDNTCPLRFDGTEANATASTLIMVYSIENSTDQFAYRDRSAKKLGFGCYQGSPRLTTSLGEWKVTYSNTAYAAGFCIVAVTWDISQEQNNIAWIYNGELKKTATIYDANITAVTDAAESYIGGDWTTSNKQLNGEIACFYVYDSILSAQELDIVGKELAAKYNLTWKGLCCEHEWGAGTVTKTVNCTVDGELTYKCTLCAETKTEVVTATGHAYVSGVCNNCGGLDPDYEGLAVAPKPVVAFDETGLTDYTSQNKYVTQWENTGLGSGAAAKLISGTLMPPIYKANALNQYPSVVFSGNATSTLGFNVEGYSFFTTIMVYKNSSSNGNMYAYKDTSALGTGLGALPGSTYSTMLNGKQFGNTGLGRDTTKFHIVVLTWDITKTENNLLYYFDGACKETATVYNADVTSVVGTAIQYLGGDGTNTQNLNGEIVCLYTYNSFFSQAIVDMVGMELAEKYNLAWNGVTAQRVPTKVEEETNGGVTDEEELSTSGNEETSGVTIDTNTTTDATDTSNGTSKSVGCTSVAGMGFAVVAIAMVVASAMVRKKEENDV